MVLNLENVLQGNHLPYQGRNHSEAAKAQRSVWLITLEMKELVKYLHVITFGIASADEQMILRYNINLVYCYLLSPNIVLQNSCVFFQIKFNYLSTLMSFLAYDLLL